MKRIRILGAEIDRISFADAAELALSCMDERRGDYAVTPNTEIVLASRGDSALCGAIRSAKLSLPDGVGLVIAARILGTPLCERIPGIDFAAALFARMAEQGRSVFLLGAREGVAVRAAAALSRQYPGLVIAGRENGFFAPEDEPALIARINAASPDLLLVCLGSPKQELWMRQHAARLHVGLMLGLGGTLDVFSGDLPRAPLAWRQNGFEWLYRLMLQPKRIHRVIKLPQIVLLAICDRIGGIPWQKGN